MAAPRHGGSAGWCETSPTVRHSGGRQVAPSEARSSSSSEDIITTRALATIPGIFLALTLAACGSSSEESSGSGSASGSEDSSESAAPAEPEAAPEDYAALFEALFDQQGKVKQPTSAEEFNQQATFPEGISLGTFDKKSQSLCVQDEEKQISADFNATDDGSIILNTGLCEDSEEISRLVEDPKDDAEVAIEGDQEVGEAVKKVFEEKFGS